VFTTSCSSTGDLGVLFLEDKWSVAYGRAAVDVYDHQCWDLCVLEAPKVTRFWVNFASHAALIWDPGLSRQLRTIMLIRPSANSTAAVVHGFPILLCLLMEFMVVHFLQSLRCYNFIMLLSVEQ
jgi:hypothetical protein